MVASPGGVIGHRGAPIHTRTAKRLACLTALLSITVLALLIGATTVSAQRQKVVTVSIHDFYFEPSQLIVEPGTTVQWVNESTTQHTVLATSPAGAFRSGTLHPGESFTHTFPQRFPKASPDSPTKPGTYEYLCEIHPGMRASVTFSESGEGPTREPEDTTVQPPPAAPITGGLDDQLLVLIGLLMIVATVGVLGWAVR